MQIKNNYDLAWEKDFGTENGMGIFNGDLGIIKEINETSKKIIVKFDDDKIVEYENSMLDQLEHSYATTIHKSQGSEFDVVIMPISYIPPMLMTRNILYTAITRAKKLLIIIGDADIIKQMIKNENVVKRNTGLKYKLEELGT